MFNRSRALLSAAIAFALSGGLAPALHSTARPQVTVSSKRKKGLFNCVLFPSSGSLIGSRASCNTVARHKRTAAKRRNQLRYKRLLKGAR
jgi:hypothetical protein